jgi:hypothetical protein
VLLMPCAATSSTLQPAAALIHMLPFEAHSLSTTIKSVSVLHNSHTLTPTAKSRSA